MLWSMGSQRVGHDLSDRTKCYSGNQAAERSKLENGRSFPLRERLCSCIPIPLLHLKPEPSPTAADSCGRETLPSKGTEANAMALACSGARLTSRQEAGSKLAALSRVR